MDYLYLDESGDLGYKGSKYLVISAILIKQTNKSLDKIIKKARKNFFVEIKESKELKATESSIELNKYIIKKLNETNTEIFSVILKKENRYKLNHNDNKNRLYDLVASEIANQIMVKNHLEIRIDKSKTKNEIQRFNEIFENSLNNKNNFKITINHNYSHNYRGLQIVDCIPCLIFKNLRIIRMNMLNY